MTESIPLQYLTADEAVQRVEATGRDGAPPLVILVCTGWADQCAPTIRRFEQAADSYPDVAFALMDAEQWPAFAQERDVRMVPYSLGFAGGKNILRCPGAPADDALDGLAPRRRGRHPRRRQKE